LIKTGLPAKYTAGNPQNPGRLIFANYLVKVSWSHTPAAIGALRHYAILIIEWQPVEESFLFI